MRSACRPLISLLIGVAVPTMAGAVIVWLVIGFGSVALAHANLLAAVPGPGQQVGGTVDGIQMVFDEPITELDVTIEGPEPSIAPTVDVVGPRQFRLTFPALETQGRYIVRYSFVSLDTDRVELAYVFDYDRSAPAALELPAATSVAEPSRWSPTLAIMIVLGSVVVLASAERLRRKRRALRRLRT